MTTLANGVRVITETMPHVRSVSVGIWIGTGSRRETAEQNGISHFIEHMLFKGTTSRSAEDIARSVDSIGGNLDAFTAKELVCFNTKVLDQHLSQAFDVLADLVLHPLFRDEDIEKEKGVILEEIKMEADSPDYLVHEIFSANFWKGHSLGKPILGTRGNREEASTGRVSRAIYKKVYAPANMLVTAAGNMKHSAWWRWCASTSNELEPAPERRPRHRSQHPRAHRPAQQEIAGAGASLPGRALVSAAPRGALRLLRAQYAARRRHELAPVPEHPRAAGPGLRRLLGAEPVPRHRVPHHLRRHVARVGAQSGGVHPQGIPRSQTAAGGRRKSCGAPRTT